MPIGLAVAGANVHDQRRGYSQQHSRSPTPTESSAHKTSVPTRAMMPKRSRSPTNATRPTFARGEEPQLEDIRRWVVERIHSWMNRPRRILVRWEKKAANYVGLLHLVFAHVLWRNC